MFCRLVTQNPYLPAISLIGIKRLNAKRADQVLSALDKLINVSQFIIRALSSPCQVANGNINHRLPHHDPSHIFAAHLASVDSSSRNTTRPKQICLEQMSNTIRLRSKHPQTWPTYRVPLFFFPHSRGAAAAGLQMFSSCRIQTRCSSWHGDEHLWTKGKLRAFIDAWREDGVLAATKVRRICKWDTSVCKYNESEQFKEYDYLRRDQTS